jgi:hypothetical protein
MIKELEALPLWAVAAIWLLMQRNRRRHSANYWKVMQHRNMLENLASQVPYPGDDRISEWLYRKVQIWIHREIAILDALIIAGLISMKIEQS